MRRFLAVLASVVAATAVIAPAATASAAQRASLSLSLGSGQATAGAPFAVSVGWARLRGARVRLQRTAGTSHVYRTVKSVPRRGAVAVPGVPMGTYSYRLVAVKHRRIVAKSAVRTLHSFGPVSSYSVCEQSEKSFWPYCNPGTISAGANVFNYSNFGGSSNNGPNGTANVQAQRSSCRSLDAYFAVENTASATSFGASLSTTNSDLQQVSGTRGNIVHASFALTSPSWNLALWQSRDDHVYWTGTLSCWTASGEY